MNCIRLSKSVLDLERSEDVEQAIGQLRSLPGADAWMSITCTYHSPLQHLNEAFFFIGSIQRNFAKPENAQ